MGILYKYMSQPNYLLKDGYLRATQLAALNDPFEATYCPNGLKKLANNIDYDGTGEELENEIKNRINAIGVISFAEAKDNLLMWSHYANEHKGAVIGFYTNEFHKISIFENLFKLSLSKGSFFDEFPPSQDYPQPVIYRKQPRYRVDMFDYDYSNFCVEGSERILFEIFQQKSDEWIYEKEHRIILRLEQADKVVCHDLKKIKNKHILNKIINSKVCKTSINNDLATHTIYLNKIKDPIIREVWAIELATLSKNPKNLYLFKVQPRAVSSVLIGINAKATDVSLNNIRKGPFGSADIYKTVLNKDFYTISFDEIYMR